LVLTDNRIIFGIPLLILQKQRIRIQNEDKSILDFFHLCKDKTEIEMCSPLNKAQEKYFIVTEYFLSKRMVEKLILYTSNQISSLICRKAQLGS